jgi:6-phosphogluconate dehydrogenase
MKIGLVGLGKMGGNMARRLRRGGIEVVAHDKSHDVAAALAKEAGVAAAASLAALVLQLPAPRVVWLMLPAGAVTEAAITDLAALLGRGDIVVDGANSYYRDSMRRSASLAQSGIRYVDAGVSGGVWGLENGYAIMMGGEPDAVEIIAPAIKVLAPAPDRGWLHCGPPGAGHFVKMVHNGIEYGMMQAMAEGFALMKGKQEFALDLAAISEMWRHGSVVRSWLLDLTADFLRQDQALQSIQPFVADSGEGRWTALEAVDLGIPAPVISLALMMRFASQDAGDYQAKLLAMMRKGFGGHAVAKT